MDAIRLFALVVLVALCSPHLSPNHQAIAGAASSTPRKIEHVVVLLEENRSFDHLFGFYKGVNGLTGNETNPLSTLDPNSKLINIDDQAPYLNLCDPDHTLPGTTSKIFGAKAIQQGNYTTPQMIGFVETEANEGYSDDDYCNVFSMFTPQKLPVISFLASEFALMDRFFSSVPGPTWPNRMYALSASSRGSTETGPWYRGVLGQLFPQRTFFDQVAEANLTWRNYYNDTPWELFMATIANNPENLVSMDQFFVDAKQGNLPNYSYLNPRSGINITTGVGSNDLHPDHDVAAGERYYKDIYEALRSSPCWNKTLFIITFDEHGGFYDHVPTPLNVPPPGDNETSYPDKFLFDRLGVRIPTLLISPWIPKGTIISAPPQQQKPFSNSEYDLTSIMATSRKLLGMTQTPALTERDAWSATFEHVLSNSEPRTDCALHTPSAPPPSNLSTEEAKRPLNDLQKHIISVLSYLNEVPFPHENVTEQGHVSEWVRKHFDSHANKVANKKKKKKEAITKVIERAGSLRKKALQVISDPSETFELVCQPALSGDFVDLCWVVNKNKSVEWETVSTMNLRVGGVAYCLDSQGAVQGTLPTVSACNSSDPTQNSEPNQHWLLVQDATLRPFINTSLCLTNELDDSGNHTINVVLLPCKDRVEQKWGYHGVAPGAPGWGFLFFGDDTNALGVIKKTGVFRHLIRS